MKQRVKLFGPVPRSLITCYIPTPQDYAEYLSELAEKALEETPKALSADPITKAVSVSFHHDVFLLLPPEKRIGDEDLAFDSEKPAGSWLYRSNPFVSSLTADIREAVFRAVAVSTEETLSGLIGHGIRLLLHDRRRSSHALQSTPLPSGHLHETSMDHRQQRKAHMGLFRTQCTIHCSSPSPPAKFSSHRLCDSPRAPSLSAADHHLPEALIQRSAFRQAPSHAPSCRGPVQLSVLHCCWPRPKGCEESRCRST